MRLSLFAVRPPDDEIPLDPARLPKAQGPVECRGCGSDDVHLQIVTRESGPTSWFARCRTCGIDELKWVPA